MRDRLRIAIGKQMTIYVRLLCISIAAITFAASCVPSGSNVTQEPTPELIDCKELEPGSYSCPGDEGHEVRVNGVPGEYTPYLWGISTQRKDSLLRADKKDTGCIFAIVGDLVFYKDGKLDSNPEFSSEVSISYTFSGKDMEEYGKCETTVMATGATEVNYIPVYFEEKVWQPFSSDEFTFSDATTVVINVTSWGDRPIGGGTQP